MSTDAALFVPYCGFPPIPDAIWSRWNLDPVLITALLGVGAAYAAGAARARLAPRERVLFLAGWLLLAAAFLSPLCSLGVALFAGRVVQHLVVTVLAAPFLVLGRPAAAFGALWLSAGRPRWRIRALQAAAGPVPATVLFAALLWVWHMPAPYDATLENNLVYWAMHLSLLGSALMVWGAILSTETERFGASVVVAFLTSLHMGLLGALITLTSRTLYQVHAQTTWPWGLSPLEDQQLGGLIMWIPGCTVFLIATLAGMAAWFRRLADDQKAAVAP